MMTPVEKLELGSLFWEPEFLTSLMTPVEKLKFVSPIWELFNFFDPFWGVRLFNYVFCAMQVSIIIPTTVD